MRQEEVRLMLAKVSTRASQLGVSAEEYMACLLNHCTAVYVVGMSGADSRDTPAALRERVAASHLFTSALGDVHRLPTATTDAKIEAKLGGKGNARTGRP